MAVLGRLLVSSSERLDLPDLLSVDSYGAGDWKFFLKGLVGDSKPYILKGFDIIDPSNAIGTQGCSIRVADSVVVYPGSDAGAFYHGLPEGHQQAEPLVPELRKNAVNYVYLTFSTFNTSIDTRAFWDPDKDGGAGGEFTQDVNTESVLKVEVNVSVGSFPANTIPVAKITVGPVVITAIEDARDLMFRLGSGGVNPDPFNTYSWRDLPTASYDRAEPPTEMMAGGINPFQGADKNILSLKEWMDAVMSKLRELGGSTYWYDDVSTFSLTSLFIDAVATAFKSKGKWIHDTVTPGHLTWTEDINIKVTADPRTYIIRNGNKTFTDEQVMYLAMIRNLPINGSDQEVQWTNGQPYINTIGGAVGLFANLAKGDYVKKVNDTTEKFLRVEEFYDALSLGGSTTTAANARSVRLSSNYLGASGAEKGRYDKGVYLAADVTVSDRNDAAIASAGGNFHWLALRSDTIENVASITTTSLVLDIEEHDGSTAKCTSGAAHNLLDGDRIEIVGSTNFDGTHVVEVESATVFYISVAGGPFADETGIDAYYATVVTSARSTPYGLQLESANHGFNTNDKIIIDGTVGYDTDYLISVRDATTFTIPVGSALATENIGTATLARIIVRTEGAATQIIQGESAGIGGSAADNIRQFIGMSSLSDTYPTYAIPPAYNTLDGMANFNATVNENLTVRVSKLTAMMADKAQDKNIELLASNYQSVRNTTSGGNQLITFNPSSTTPSATVLMAGSANNGIINLTGTLTLAANQLAYFTVDRNASFLVANLNALTVVDVADFVVDENTFVFATRLTGTTVWLWDGEYIDAQFSNPTTNYLNKVDVADRTGFFRSDDQVTWTGTQLEFISDIELELLDESGTLHTYTIDSSNSPLVLADGEYAWIQVDRNLTTQTVVPSIGSAYPAQPIAGLDIYPFLKRIDAGGEGFLHIPFHKQLLSTGQTVRLGASGSGSGTVKANFLDPLNTTLPIGPTYTADNVPAVNGDLILFTNLGIDNNRIYEISGVGVAIAFTAVRAFNGQFDPADADSVRIMEGDAFHEQLAIFDGTNFLVNDTVRHFDGVSADFWEQSSLKTITLPNNATTNVFTVSYAGSENMFVDYSIVRAGTKETGIAHITTNGTTATVTQSGAYIGSVGTTFVATIVGADLLLDITTTNAGPSSILKYFVRRWSDAPGGPTGIPNYNTGGGGGSTPAAGNLGEVQYNGPGNLLAAEARFKWDSATGSIVLNGLELSSLSNSVVINDNQGAPVVITSYAAASYNFNFIKYSLVRGTNRRQGILTVITNGITVDIADEFQEMTPGLGVTFNAVVNGANIDISYTSTNTGTAGTMKYFSERWV